MSNFGVKRVTIIAITNSKAGQNNGMVAMCELCFSVDNGWHG